MYRLIVLFFMAINLWAVEIDPNLENSLSKYDIQNRLLLVRYYMSKEQYKKAEKYNNEILEIDPNNKLAQINARKIRAYFNLKNILKGEDVNSFYKKLYYAKNYKAIKALTPYLQVIDSDYPKLLTAKIYMWDGKYKEVDDILRLVKNRRNDQYREIKAYSCYYNGDYTCAKRLFTILFNKTGKMDYAYKLVNSMMYLGETDKVNMFLRRFPNNQKLKKLKEALKKKKQQQLQQLEAQYKKTHSFATLQELVYILFKNGEQKKAYKMLDDYVKQYPMDKNAKYWYAKYLMWYGHNDKALSLLQEIVTPTDYKTQYLIAQIYAWTGKYKRAIKIVDNIMAKASDKNLILDAAELKGLVYYWQHDYKKAKPLLEDVLKNRKSEDAKEALMVINGNLMPLIDKYKRLSAQHPTNATYILKVAQYSELAKDMKTAMEYYERYFRLKPDMNIAHRLALYYLKQKNFKKGFYFYKQWAYSRNDVDGMYQLAKDYFYYGFKDKALKVIKDILALQPYEPAVKLKRIILSTQKNATCTTFYKKGVELERQGQLELAKKMYHNGLNIVKKDTKIEHKKPIPLYVRRFINEWKRAWESKNINRYKNFYSKRYRHNRRWLNRKKRIFRHARYIRVQMLDLHLVKTYKKGRYKYYVVKFYQKYTNGRHRDGGYKTLTIRCKGYKCHIYKEYWKAGRYIPPRHRKISLKDEERCKELITLRLQAIKKYDILAYYQKKKDVDGYLTDKGVWLTSKKDIEDTHTVFSTIDINLTKKLTIKKGDTRYTPISKFAGKYGVKGYYSIDKDKTIIYNNGVYFDGKYMYMDMKYWRLWRGGEKRFGRYSTIHFKYGKNIKLGAEIGSYNTKNSDHRIVFYMHPFMEYQAPNKITFQYFQVVTGRDKASICSVDEALRTDKFVVSKYMGSQSAGGKDITKLSYSLELAKTENNLAITPQFLYRFNPYNKFKDLEFYYFISGWYQENTHPSTCYYSPKKYDSTFIEIHPVFKKVEVIGKLGYSFETKDVLKTLGINYAGNIVTAGCTKNYSYRNGKPGYWYLECNLDAGVKW